MDVEVDVWENQRYVLFRGWGPYRSPLDRESWSNKKGNCAQFRECALCPVGYVWTSPWRLDHHRVATKKSDNKKEEGGEGWLYAPDFTVPTRFCTTKANPLTIVRRRRWTRTRREVVCLNTTAAATTVASSPVALPTPATNVPVEVYLTHSLETLSMSEINRSFATWCQTSCYGFAGANVAAQMSEQQRNHLSFLRLLRYVPSQFSTTLDEPTIPPNPRVVEGIPVGEEHDKNNKDHRSRGLSTPSRSATVQATLHLQHQVGDSGPVDDTGYNEGKKTNSSGKEKSVKKSKKNDSYLQDVYKYGVATVLRRHLWSSWVGAEDKRRQHPVGYYKQLSDQSDVLFRLYTDQMQSAAVVEGEIKQQLPVKYSTMVEEIKQDVVRTAPRHPFFAGAMVAGVSSELQDVSGSYALFRVQLCCCLHPNISEYHQAFSYLAAVLLLNMNEEEAFWVLLCILQDVLPRRYHDTFAVQCDVRILQELISESFPKLDAVFERRQVDVTVFATGWVQGLFCAHFPFTTAARLLDVMLAEGDSTVLVRMPFAYFSHWHDELSKVVDGSCTMGQMANQWARDCFDVEAIVTLMSCDSLALKIEKRRSELMNN